MTTLAVQSPTFTEEAKAVVGAVRRAMSEVLRAVEADPSEPQEISRRFGLDKTLTWRIARVIREENPWDAVPHIPRRPSIRILVDALGKHGLTAERAGPLWRAIEEFERFVETHSGDRETLEMMVSPAGKRSAAKRLELFRKQGYQANSAIFGVQARLQFALRVLSPSRVGGPEGLDLATLCGLLDFRRLRANVPWAIATLSGYGGDDRPELEISTGCRAMDATITHGDPPLVREFCTEPSLNLQSIPMPGGTVRYELGEGPVGNTAATDAVLGWIFFSQVSRHASVMGEPGEHLVLMSTPAETLIHDLWVHRSLEFAMNPTWQAYSMLPGGPRYPQQGREVGLLPVPGEVVDLGAGPPDTTTPEIPRYDEMARHAVERMGWKVEDFRAFRVRLKYPPIPAMGVFRHDLLPPKGT